MGSATAITGKISPSSGPGLITDPAQLKREELDQGDTRSKGR